MAISIKLSPHERNRKAAAKVLYKMAERYENVTQDAVYKKCFFDHKWLAWRFIGKNRNYTYYYPY